jgi:hypothetical protein
MRKACARPAKTTSQKPGGNQKTSTQELLQNAMADLNLNARRRYKMLVLAGIEFNKDGYPRRG